jgi:hypothetical protein
MLVPVALAVLFWCCPPDGDDAYHHTMGAVEQVRAWQEGAVFPRYHRGWNGGTGTFAPTIYSPIPLSVQGGLAWAVGEGRRAVGISLAVALLTLSVSLVFWSGEPIAALAVLTPYVVAVAVSRSTTTEAWSLAGAATVLSLAMPGVAMTRRRGLSLAAGIFWVAGCQVGMLVQLVWLLGAAWAVALIRNRKSAEDGQTGGLRSLVSVMSWAIAGLLSAAILWLPAIVDARHLAVSELTSGPLDWRHNFLPGASEIAVLLTAVAASLVGAATIVVARGESRCRLPLAAAIAVGAAFCTPLSAPLWHVPKMAILQFPWRFLGLSTIVAVLAVTGLRGRWRTAAIVLLVLPLVLLPIRIGSTSDVVPTRSSPEELALIAHQQWGLAPVLPSARGFYSTGFDRIESLKRFARQEAKVVTVDRHAGEGSWRVVTDRSRPVLLPLQWWPEWRITVDAVDVGYSNQSGLVAVVLDRGVFEINASLDRSASRFIAVPLSVGGIALLLLLVWLHGRDLSLSPTSRAAR